MNFASNNWVKSALDSFQFYHESKADFIPLTHTARSIGHGHTPDFAALLWIRGFPSLYVTVLGLITTFPGYTAVYALNDVVDHRVDKEKLKRGGFQDYDDYLDAVLVYHPIAQGFLSFKEGRK